jgi:hypothetical protein
MPGPVPCLLRRNLRAQLPLELARLQIQVLTEYEGLRVLEGCSRVLTAQLTLQLRHHHGAVLLRAHAVHLRDADGV